ncbi:MAG TPA: L,D-transpeptidase [Bacteroidales bacterium]
MKILLIKIAAAITFLLLLIFLFSPGMNELFVSFFPGNTNSEIVIDSEENESAEVKQLSKKVAELQKKLNDNIPKSNYIIINTTTNTFELVGKNGIIRKGICSTGKNVELVRDSTKKWVFHTPKGVFKVRNKVTDPVWTKPDWAFVEDGLPIPSYKSPERYEYGVLGDYALVLGDGYMIHGTIYQRFLGMPVTHGCVRLGDDDLEVVYKNLAIGSKVFMY